MIELIAALAKAQGQMTMAQFDATNPAFKKPDGMASRYATLASIINAVRPALSANGIAYIQRVEMLERGVGVETILMGHGAELRGGLVVVPLDKATAQGMGSALTYGKRFSLAAICGIAADDDDDATTAESHAPGAPATIGADQLAALQDAIDAAGLTAEKFCKGYAVSAVAQLPADKYDAAMKVLEARAKKLAEAAA